MTLDALIREPDGDSDGAFVLVHGRGSDEHDLHPLFDILDPGKKLVGVAPGGPLSLPTTGSAGGARGRHWYGVARVGFPEPETFRAGYAALTAFLDEWLAERAIAWEDTILGGFSQGTAMSYAVGLGAGRPRPRAILAMSGFIPTVEGFEIDLEARRELPVLVSHGTNDEVIGVSFAEDAAARLTAAGLQVQTQFSAGGHHIDPRSVPAISEWLAECTRPTTT